MACSPQRAGSRPPAPAGGERGPYAAATPAKAAHERLQTLRETASGEARGRQGDTGVTTHDAQSPTCFPGRNGWASPAAASASAPHRPRGPGEAPSRQPAAWALEASLRHPGRGEVVPAPAASAPGKEPSVSKPRRPTPPRNGAPSAPGPRMGQPGAAPPRALRGGNSFRGGSFLGLTRRGR